MIISAQDAAGQALKFGHITRDEVIMAMPEYDSAMIKYNAFGQELSNALEIMQVELEQQSMSSIPRKARIFLTLSRQIKSRNCQICRIVSLHFSKQPRLNCRKNRQHC